MNSSGKLVFRIDSFTPETLPMARLAEYLVELARLYGNESAVHFDKVKRGSALLQVNIDEPAVPLVVRRLKLVPTSEGDNQAKKAFQAIDKLLRVDNAVGTITAGTKSKILEFPGRRAAEDLVFVVSQPTTIDGVVIKIGGKDETIPVTLRDQEGVVFNCQIKGQARAKELSRFFLGAPIRAHGTGKWKRYPDGNWELDSLFIQDYEELDSSPAEEVLSAITQIAGNGWKKMDDPLGAWRKLRGIE